MWRDDAYILDMLIAACKVENFADGVTWRMIIGMRNRLVHEYFDIIPERVWDVVQNNISELIRIIEPLVPPDELP